MESQLPPKRGTVSQFSVHVYCGQTARWIKMPLGTEVDLVPGYIVLDGDPATQRKGHSSQAPFSAHVYCGHGRLSQLLISSCTNGRPKTERCAMSQKTTGCSLWPTNSSYRPTSLLRYRSICQCNIERVFSVAAGLPDVLEVYLQTYVVGVINVWQRRGALQIVILVVLVVLLSFDHQITQLYFGRVSKVTRCHKLINSFFRFFTLRGVWALWSRADKMAPLYTLVRNFAKRWFFTVLSSAR